MNVSFLDAQHHTSMIDLLVELYEFYQDGRATRDAVEKHFTENLSRPDAPFRMVVASEGDLVLGFAAIALHHSFVNPNPENNRQCLMKELYVANAHRDKGVGEAILSWVMDYARAQGCCRIDWNVKSGNHDGIRFYERLGARRVEDRLSYRLVL